MELNTDTILQEEKLHYSSETQPGITRKKSGKSWKYTDQDGNIIQDQKILKRLSQLVLPPAWTSVRICASPHGHLQATGSDSKGRKQYRYHPKRIKARSETKFTAMKEFGKILPTLRKKLKKDLRRKKLCQEKILATTVTLMDKTGIRIGNEVYEKLYGSYGLTTLRNKHIAIHGSVIDLRFKGKKGVKQHITLRDKRLAKIIQQRKDLPGKDLFEYIDEQGEIKKVTSDLVNDYIYTLIGKRFTAKDFRTRHGSSYSLAVLHQYHEENLSTAQLIDLVAKELGNTRTVCRKYYIHPSIISWHEAGKLSSLFKKYCNTACQESYGKAFRYILSKEDSSKKSHKKNHSPIIEKKS